MSTDLTPISGKQESVVSVVHKKVEHRDSQLHLTVFWGGSKRGACVQLGLSGGDHIQLDKVGAEKLIDELDKFLDGRY